MIFTIMGNQRDTRGNPIPYHRTTQRARFAPEHRRYEEWKGYVRACASLMAKIDLSDRYCKIEMDIEWANNKHCDGDNVLKGVNDSLFSNDKNVIEGHYKCNPIPTGQGKIIVKLTFYEKTKGSK